MAEGPLVSVQHRLSAAQTLATRAHDSCVAARHLTATLPPERTTPVRSSIRRFPLDSPQLQHPPTTLTPLPAQEHREKLGTATRPLSAVLDGDHLLGASPLRSTSGLVFDFPSTTAP
jgi:hypothetical protein